MAINYSPDQAPGSPSGGTGAYNVNPSPRGTGGILGDIFGRIPGTVGLPDPYSDLSHAYPNLGPTNAQGSQDILSNLTGELSPATLSAIHGAASRFGLPTGNLDLQDPSTLGETSDQLKSEGLKEVNPFEKTVSSTQTVSPETQAMIAEFNSMNKSAPDPGIMGAVQTGLKVVGSLAAFA